MNLCSKTAAVITAAGLSSRMGRFKPLLPLKDGNFISRITESFREAGVEDIIVVTGNKASLIRESLQGLPVIFVHNANYENSDMFDSFLAGLKALPAGYSSVFVTTADIPLFLPFSLKEMLREMDEKGEKAPDMIKPCYCGRGGHPMLINLNCIKDFTSYKGGDGLRGAMRSAGIIPFRLSLPDPGVVLDADTLEDYEKLLQYEKNMHIPSIEQCCEIQDYYNMNEKTRGHCEMVAKISLEISNSFKEAGYEVDISLVNGAALLHDIAKGHKDHDKTGARCMKELGFYSIAEIISWHMELDSYDLQPPYEKYIVYLADKMVEEDKFLGIEERFRRKLEATKGEMRRRILEKQTRALSIQKQMEVLLGKPIIIGEEISL